MADSNDDQRPMAEPGTGRPGASTGGIASTADGGLQNATQRSFERGLADATPGARTGEARASGSAPRTDLGGTPEPGAGPGSRTGVDVPGAGNAPGKGSASTAPRASGAGAEAGADAVWSPRAGAGPWGVGAGQAPGLGGHAGGSAAGTNASHTGSAPPPQPGSTTSSRAPGPQAGRDEGLRGTPPRGSPGGDPTGAGELEDLPEAPRDESAAQSLGRAVSEVVTGVFDSPDNPRDKERR